MMSIPQPVQYALETLRSAGYAAYLVGGCVRDALRGRTPKDFDLTTNARPDVLQRLFAAVPCIPTGLRHGTLTILPDGMPIEITTYRVDGVYSDGRRPDSVCFSDCLTDDLARRDFTVNAMAYHPQTGLVDPFGGQADLSAGILRCVGAPTQRFSEDALRILRGLRFSATLGLTLAPETAAALHTERERLLQIAPERIRAELDGLLTGEDVTEILLSYPDVLGVPVPEILPCVGFAQCSPYHRYTVWGHIAHAVGAAPPVLPVRLALLLHDIGKPNTFALDETGRGHFKGHAEVSAVMAETILTRLRYDKKTIAAVCTLVARHREKPANEAQVRRLLSKIGEEQFFQLLEVRRADTRAKQEFCLDELAEVDRAAQLAKQLMAENACLKLRDLLVDGNDLQMLGAQGRCIGAVLSGLLERVLDGSLPNSREALLAEAERQIAYRRET